jgi:hypothetical protein
MMSRILATLIVAYDGVPVGRTSLVELPPIDRKAVPEALRVNLPTPPEFGVHGFEPLAGYDAVRDIVLSGSVARANFGYLGPVADPDSDRRGRDAINSLRRLVDELEFRDEAGDLIPVKMIVLSEYGASLETSAQRAITLGGIVQELPASVFARLHAPRLRDAGRQS